MNAGIAAVLTRVTRELAFVAATAGATRAPLPLVANWIAGELMPRSPTTKNVDFPRFPSRPSASASCSSASSTAPSPDKAAKQVLLAIAQDGGEPDDVIERLGLRQISDSGALEAAVEKVLAANAKLVDDYRAGKEKAFNALVGQVMKATQGKANPAQVNEILQAAARGRRRADHFDGWGFFSASQRLRSRSYLALTCSISFWYADDRFLERDLLFLHAIQVDLQLLGRVLGGALAFLFALARLVELHLFPDLLHALVDVGDAFVGDLDAGVDRLDVAVARHVDLVLRGVGVQQRQVLALLLGRLLLRLPGFLAPPPAAPSPARA